MQCIPCAKGDHSGGAPGVPGVRVAFQSMMKCDYSDGTNCGNAPEWYMIAGTTECEDIVEGHICDKHRLILANITNLPHSLKDSHGHTMEEVMFSSLFIDMAPMVYVNDTPYPCKVCGKGFLDPVKATECEMRHAENLQKTANLPSYLVTCHMCHKTYSTPKEASDCAVRDQRARYGPHECPVCKRPWALESQAQICCRKWVARRYQSFKKMMKGSS